MAHAKAKSEVVGVTLELTLEEAEALQTVLSCIGGSQMYSRRRQTHAIFCVLKDCGIAYDISDIEGVINFKHNEDI